MSSVSDFAAQYASNANSSAGLNATGTGFRGGAMPADSGYCVKCKAIRKMVDAKEVTTKNGRKMLKGKCTKCSTTMCRILGNSKK